MAEIAGLALSVVGAVGLLGQLFDGCITGYRVFSTAKNLGKDSEKMVCKIRIEEMRLWVWGREWGVVEGRFEAHLSSTSWEGLKDLAKDILEQLLGTILDCHKLQDKYGLREEAPGSVDQDAYSTCKKAADPATSSFGSRFRKDMKLKARWVIADREKFDTFVQDLSYFNDRLEKLFPPGRVETLQRTWTNELLHTAQRDLDILQLLETSAVEKYPSLNTLARLKQLRINLDGKEREPSRKILSSSELKIRRERIQVDASEKAVARRVRAVYSKPLDTMRDGKVSEDVPVLIDWIDYDAEMELDSRLHLYQRVDNLSRMLHSCSSRHPDLHTLDCLGYVEDTKSHRYGVVHNGPQLELAQNAGNVPPFQNLYALLGDNDKDKRTPDLDVRIKLAHTLAIALWSFHSLDWLHKSFSSHNVLFFTGNMPSGAQHHDLRHPYVVGFDSSRPDGLAEMTADPIYSEGQDIYRHPSSLGVWRQSYRKAFDIYSLGLVLLEIGLWRSVRSLYKPKYSHTVFKEKVLQLGVPALGSKTGSLYRGIVEKCISYDDQDEKHPMSPHQMMEQVVSTLESLNV
ncbi:hypothetical protein EJ05DRAFT_188374 [Pseudovirgaria hyperparasitica]|uniref:Uncharacterized protein n=1 Tax=Pseudovirgaria hyperparasitica TaxID=470096 RepID=A0A6A6WIN0_9PEZI|nr:uncharacterized protein EJ05DRAFT_188374 [Pseudovirgaria hyperparasitica]KAF2761896.1 hypothetical protein EJ05DRAFT_188374 [Pseudovirgaria hyperparasitica]